MHHAACEQSGMAVPGSDSEQSSNGADRSGSCEVGRKELRKPVASTVSNGTCAHTDVR